MSPVGEGAQRPTTEDEGDGEDGVDGEEDRDDVIEYSLDQETSFVYRRSAAAAAGYHARMMSTPMRRPSLVSELGRRAGLCGLALILLSLVPTVVGAWNGVGHELVARVAWLEMSPDARQRAVELLAGTEEALSIRAMRPAYGARRDQVWFERASTWPDWVRSELPSENRSGWHYTNFFWTQDDRGRARDLPDRTGAPVNIVTELPRLVGVLGDESRPASERGVALAWVLHLVGDLHQPLHCSARVTEDDPEGDRGGNDFKLAPAVAGREDWRRDNLHRLWDSSLTRQWPKSFWESEWRYRERLLERLSGAVPKTTPDPTPESLGAEVVAWAREGYELAKSVCYPPALVRNRPAPPDVLQVAAETASRRVAIAGRRLASILDAALGSD